MRVSLLAAAAIFAVFGGSALAQTPPPMPPKDFVAAVSHSDQYEILAGRVAVTQSRDPRVRAFAEQMIRDHTQTTQNLRQAAIQAGVEPPPPSLGDNAMLLASLQGLTGADFDRTYAQQQTLAHAQALAVIGLYAREGTAPALRQAAQSTLPMIRSHADQAQQLKSALGGS